MTLKAQISNSFGVVTEDSLQETLSQGLARRYTNERVLILIPDHTRTIPLPFFFRSLAEILADVRQLDFMVALGTHPPLDDASLNLLVGITAEQRESEYKHITLLNHAWDTTDALKTIGVLPQEQIGAIAGDKWHDSLGGDVPVNINRQIFEYDHILILGPTFPHEVAGFSGGAKYLFPGISGPEMINVSHWLGALVGVVDTIGVKETPTRAMIHAAAAHVELPVTLISMVVVQEGIAGLYIGDLYEAWSAAADLSSQRHIIWVDRPFQRVLSRAPAMYDELWTAGKAMYKLEPALAEGGELIIYAPHLDTVSFVHGKHIREIGYHVLPYFLNQWDKFKHVPLGVLAHSTHVRGGGRYDNDIEYPRATVKLATRLGPEACAELALEYLDPQQINLSNWEGQEADGVLYVPKSGEMLYKVKP